MESPNFSFSGRIRSFRYAARGIGLMVKSQHNCWVHCAASILVLFAGLGFEVSAQEWCLLVIAIVCVMTAEALNTAFELLCDVASPDFHPVVEKSKDVAAGAVLLSAIGSVVIGILVFGPRMSASFEKIFHLLVS